LTFPAYEARRRREEEEEIWYRTHPCSKPKEVFLKKSTS